MESTAGHERVRRAAWSFAPALVLTIGLLVLSVAVLAGDPATDAVVAVSVIGALAVGAVVMTWLEAQRFRRRLQTTIDALADTNVGVRRLLDDLPDAVIGVDASGSIVSANARAIQLTGRAEADLIGRSFFGLVVDDDVDDVSDRWRRVTLTDATDGVRVEPVGDPESRLRDTTVFELLDADGAHHLVEASLHRPASFESSPRSASVIVLLRDVTDRERSSTALDAARRRFQQAFHSAPTGMALVRLSDHRIVDANQALADMLDHSRRYLLGRSIREITHPDDLRRAAAERARIELGIDDGYRIEQRYLRRDGAIVWAKTQVAVTSSDDPDGGPLAITHIEDITEQRRNEQRLTHAATHDDLTQLPNRASIVARLDELLATAGPDEIAVLFIDLDNFKVVNDSLGHRVGDELLRHVASRFRSVMREGDQVARFGGDEFVVFVDGTTRHTDATGEIRVGAIDPAKVAERLQRSVQDAVVIDGHELVVTASIGFSTNAVPGMSADDLLRDADAAMYRAKRGGRDRVERFTDDVRSESIAELQTVTELRRALERGEITPYFQPIVELDTGRIVSFEVLVRWLHPERGLLAPAQFLPVADAAGLMGEIGERMLRDSLAQLASWRAAGDAFGACSLSVNLTAQQLGDPLFLPTVRDALAMSGIEAEALWFEITETALLDDVQRASAALRELRGLGVHLSVDDFGTGYSSLTYLKHFPVEAIKIDRSFVDGLGIDAGDASIVDAVVRLGRSLGLAVVAEGVESPLQLAHLREIGADRGQGYLFGRPAPARLLRDLDAVPGATT